MLVEAFNAYDGIPIITKPAWTRGRSVEALASYLTYEKRRHAVAVVSADEDGKCLFNPTLLSLKLTALAHVFVLQGDACHRRFAELIPNPKLLVWDGAARIYYPGFSPEASPFAHPLIGPRSIRESLEERGQSEFCEGILGQIAIAATQRGFPGAIFWDGLDDLIADEEIRKHKESANFSHKVVEVYEEEKKKLLKKIEDLEYKLKEFYFPFYTNLKTESIVGSAFVDRKNDVEGNPLAKVSSRPDFVASIYPGPSFFANGGTPPIPRDAPPAFITLRLRMAAAASHTDRRGSCRGGLGREYSMHRCSRGTRVPDYHEQL
jgi:hypothetical protein